MSTTSAGIGVLLIAVLSNHGASDEPFVPDPVVDALLAAHNQERALRKLGPLRLSPQLCEAAENHARDMTDRMRLSHTGRDGSTPAQRARRVGYGSSHVGENVAGAAQSVDQVMLAWMNSPGHRGNILGDYTEMGAARVENEFGLIYWCVDFGGPMRARRKAVGDAGAAVAVVSRVNAEAAAAFITRINTERQRSGKAPLNVDPRLARAAMNLSSKMAAKDSLEFEGDPVKLIDEKTREGRDIHIEVGADIPTPQEAARQLVGEHEEQLEAYREIGVGYALTKRRKPYWCVLLAKPHGINRPGRPTTLRSDVGRPEGLGYLRPRFHRTVGMAAPPVCSCVSR
jgi:uncharacterized protein YkwD